MSHKLQQLGRSQLPSAQFSFLLRMFNQGSIWSQIHWCSGGVNGGFMIQKYVASLGDLGNPCTPAVANKQYLNHILTSSLGCFRHCITLRPTNPLQYSRPGHPFRSPEQAQNDPYRMVRVVVCYFAKPISQKWSPWLPHTGFRRSHRRWRRGRWPGRQDLPHRHGWRWPCMH